MGGNWLVAVGWWQAADARKSQRHSGGDPRTPVTPGRTSDPLESRTCCACHANHSGTVAATHGRQGVHPTPWRAGRVAPAAQITPAERRRPANARAYIRTLESMKCCACHANHTGRAAATHGRQGVHPTPWRARSVAPATQIAPAEGRRPTDAGDARPLGGGASDPLESTKCCACYENHTSRGAATHGRQGVHPTPWRVRSAARKSHRERGGDPGIFGEREALPLPRKSHQQRGGDPRTPGRTSDPLESTKRFNVEKKQQLDDGWPESETCNCPALSKRCIEREKERVDVKE